MARDNAKETKLASVLSFEKKLVPSDGLLYGTRWEERDEKSKETLLPLREKSVRGTISNRLDAATQSNPLKLNAKVENANLQTVDAASLSLDQDTLKVKFTLKILSGASSPSACNVEEHRRSILAMGEEYQKTFGFSELAKRYALNIANARYLWRNRVGAEKIEVHVTSPQTDRPWQFDAYQYNLQNFDTTESELDRLASFIQKALAGEIPFLFLEIEAFALLGNGQEIYPSEELVLDKGRGRKSKILYAVDGTAALHSQKIGNALRTIDTWYPAYGTETGIGPIAIEPYGAVTTRGTAYRSGKDKADFYTLFDRHSQGEPMTDPQTAHYVMAVLIRGGVFGQSGKD